jgi:anti-sigma factor RsiW
MEQIHPLGHVPEEWFEQYVQGTLPEDKLGIFEERLLVDEAVRQTEAYIKAMKVALRRAQTELATEPSVWARLKSWVAVPVPVLGGLSAAAVALLIFVSVHRGPSTLPPPNTVELHALRGGNDAATVPAGHIRLVLDTRGLSTSTSDSVEVVTEDGKSVWKSSLNVSGDSVAVDVPRLLAAGQYLVRINQGSDLLREYAVGLK